MDKIFIRQLKVLAHIGIVAWEHENHQNIFFDIDIAVDANRIVQTDDINHTVDYTKVKKCISQFVARHRFNLIETLADKIATLLIENFNIPWLRLTLTKPRAFEGDALAGVTIERSS